MKRNMIQRAAALLVMMLVLAAAFPAAARAEGSTLLVTGYTVTDAYGFPLASVAKGASVNITVSLRDIGGTEAGQLDAVKLDDSFTGGSLSVARTSAEGMPLTYEVRLTGLQYKGVGQGLKLQVGTAGSPESYQAVDLTITEAVVFEAPQPQQPPAPEPAPAPMVLVSRSELSGPVEAGQEVVLKITYENADQQVQTREFPVTLHVTAPPPPEDFPDDFDPDMDEGGFPWLTVGLAAGGAVLAGGGGLLIWKKKKGGKAEESSWDNWDDTPPSNEGE